MPTKRESEVLRIALTTRRGFVELERQIARNTVFLSQDRPSHVILPIVPPRA
jgi:hypothetical protein